MNYRLITFGIMIIVFIFSFLKVYDNQKLSDKKKITTKAIVRVAIFGALSAILYIFIKFPVPFFPSFLEFHFDEIPVFISSFAYGPITGICVLLVKTIIKLPFTSTMGVGELCDFIFSAAFILPGALIYKRKRKMISVIVGLLIGSIFQLVISFLGNILIIIPFYIQLMGFSEEAILSLCQMANPGIKDLGFTYGLLAVLPFNLVKNIIVILLTIFTYKSIHKFIDKIAN